MPDTLLAPAAAELTEMLQNQQVEKNDEEETYGANSLLIVAENVHWTVTSKLSWKHLCAKTDDMRFTLEYESSVKAWISQLSALNGFYL